MSITSIGASFGYIDPGTLAGPTQSTTPASNTDDSPTPASADASSDSSSSSTTPTPKPPQASSSDGPKFAPDTGAALVKVQEKATTPAPATATAA